MLGRLRSLARLYIRSFWRTEASGPGGSCYPSAMPKRFGRKTKSSARRSRRPVLASLRARLGKLPRATLPLAVGGLAIGAVLGAILAPSHGPKSHAVVATNAVVAPLPVAKPTPAPAPAPAPEVKTSPTPPAPAMPAATPAWQQLPSPCRRP